MFAVVKTGGKQYRVAADEKITVARLQGEAGDSVTLDNVLMVVDGDKSEFGAEGAGVAGASIAATIVAHIRGDKVIAFKKRRRQNSKRKRGHRQDYTVIQISEILTGGAKASGKAAAKPKAAKKPKAEAEAAPAAAGDAA